MISKYLEPANFRAKRRILLGIAFVIFAITEVLLGTGLLTSNPFLIAIPVVPLALLGSLLYIQYGAILLLLLMLLVRVGISTGTESIIPFSLVFMVSWTLIWVLRMALDHELKLVISKINVPSLVFLVITGISMLWSRFFIDPQLVVPGKFIQVQLGTLAFTAMSVLLPIICLNLVRDARIVKASMVIILLASLYYVPVYIFENFKSGGIIAREDSDFNHPTTLNQLVNAEGLFSLWICALCLALLLFAPHLKKWHRVIVFVVLALWLFRLVTITLIRISSWVPAVIAMLVILFIYSRKWFFIIAIIATVLVAFNFDLFYSTIVLQKAEEGTLAGAASRQNLIFQALSIAKDHLLLGTGPGGYRNYYLTYYPDLVLSTHNNYLDMLLQYGIIGFVSYLWLLVSLLRELYAAMRWQIRGTFEHAFTVAGLAGGVGMLVGMALGDWVIPFAYNQTISGFSYTAYNWLFPGLALALGQIARQKRLSQEAAQTRNQTAQDGGFSDGPVIEGPIIIQKGKLARDLEEEAVPIAASKVLPGLPPPLAGRGTDPWT